VFISEKFDLGIGEEWLPRVGLTDDGTSDKLTDTASDVIEWLFTDESCDEVTDMTEWLSSLPNVGSIMDVDKGDSTFSVRSSKVLRTMSSLVKYQLSGWSYHFERSARELGRKHSSKQLIHL